MRYLPLELFQKTVNSVQEVPRAQAESTRLPRLRTPPLEGNDPDLPEGAQAPLLHAQQSNAHEPVGVEALLFRLHLHPLHQQRTARVKLSIPMTLGVTSALSG